MARLIRHFGGGLGKALFNLGTFTGGKRFSLIAAPDGGVAALVPRRL